MRTAYTYCVLRYVHDAVGREFVNVGVVAYAPTVRYVGSRCTKHYSRAAHLFGGVDGGAFRRLTGFVETEINRLGSRISTGLPLLPNDIRGVLALVLPQDDSAMQFSEPGAGVSHDLEATLADLYERFVGRYERPKRESRTEDDVWKTFREPLAEHGVVHLLHPKRIVTRDYEYEFEHAWKNARWHAMEPISFDLADDQHILHKAARWVGSMTGLQESQEKFKLHVLLGAPQDPERNSAYVKAQNLLHKMPTDHEFHSEDEADQVADWLADQVRLHEVNEGG